MKKNIAIDIDDVLLGFNKVVLNDVNDKFNTNYKLSELKWNYTNLEDEHRAYAESIYANKSVHDRLELIDGAMDFVNWCSNYLDIIFVTSVWADAIPYRDKRLKELFGHIDYSTIYTHRKDLVKTDIMIDDSLNHVQKSTANKRLLLRKPWNDNYINDINKNDYDLINSYSEAKLVIISELSKQ